MSEAPVKYGDHQKASPGTPCEACGGITQQPVVDHCHEHGWVRGIACLSCNSRMGFVDQRIAPKANALVLAGLLALWHRCPECGQLDASELGTRTSRAKFTAQISVNLTADQAAWLDRYAASNRWSRSTAVAVLIDHARDELGDDAR